MKIKYEIEDGYAGPSRPHYVTISDSEIQECKSIYEVESLIDDYVDDDFNNKISSHWDRNILKDIKLNNTENE